MPISDTKKVQTMVNITGQQMQAIRAAVQAIKDVRTAFNTHNPDVTGTVLDGNLAALNSSLNAIDTEVAKAVWTNLIAAVVPTHRGRALD
jgi:hypothetical protein